MLQTTPFIPLPTRPDRSGCEHRRWGKSREARILPDWIGTGGTGQAGQEQGERLVETLKAQ